MQIEVVRSERRKKTVEARMVDGVLRVRIPGHFTRAEEGRWVEEMADKFAVRQRAAQRDLAKRSASLADRFSLPRPQSISWSERQHTLWASCSVASGAIRVSTAVSAFPDWVLDYVIVHELAHLVESSHSADFWELVGRYPRSERAQGYLVAKADGR